MRVENLNHHCTSELQEYGYFDLDVWTDDEGTDWVIALTESDAYKAACDEIEETVFSAGVDYIVSALDCCQLLENCPDYVAEDRENDSYGETMYVVTEYIKELQEGRESSNDLVLEVIGSQLEDWKDFVLRTEGIAHTITRGEHWEETNFSELSEDLQEALTIHYDLNDDEKLNLSAFPLS